MVSAAARYWQGGSAPYSSGAALVHPWQFRHARSKLVDAHFLTSACARGAAEDSSAFRWEAVVKRLSEYREVALRFRALADHGTERDLRAELKRLSADLAAWIVAAEIKAMTGEKSAVVMEGEHGSPSRWRWRWRWRGWWPWRQDDAAPA
jgi:hypothetical protein